jgi:hypothetical protein
VTTLHGSTIRGLFQSFIVECQAQQCSPGLTKAQLFPVCPGTLVTYTCIVDGTNYTAWTGSRFFHFCNDTLNETIIAHYNNENNGSMDLTFNNVSECGPFVAIRNDARTIIEGCYTSNLEFIASNPAIFNGTSIECLDGDGREIGMDVVNIAGDCVFVCVVGLYTYACVLV